MNTLDRRHLLKTAAGAGAAAADKPEQRIKIDQIGTGHEHASGKMGALRKLHDQYEVVGTETSFDLASRVENPHGRK